MATCKDFDSGSDQITQPCDYCSNVSDGYCHDCEMFMCQACFDKHTKARPCRHHVLVDNSSKPDMKDKCSKTCVRHPLQKIQFYCVDHKLVGCSQCFFPGHRYCRFEEIQEAAKEFHDRGDDSRLKDKLHELERKHSEYRNQCDEDKEAVSVMNTQVVNDVKSFVKDVIAFAKKVESHALEEAERLRIDNETRVEKRMTDLDNVGENIEQCLVKLEKQPTAEEFFIAAIEVKPEVEKLEQKLTSIEGLGAVRRYTFTPRSDVIEMIQDVRSCGEIRTISENPEIEDEDEEANDDVNSEHNGSEQTCKLLISDIPSTVDDDYITWFFERKKNFGGLEVEDVVYNEEEGCAIVEFGSPDDVEAVSEKVPIKMKGQDVSVDRYELVHNSGYRYPPTSEQNQANYSGNQGYPNFPPLGQGQSYFYPPDAGNNPQAPPYGPPHGLPPALPPGMMLVQDPNTKVVFMVPIPGFQHGGQPIGQPKGQPSPYAEQENFNTQNKKKFPPESSND